MDPNRERRFVHGRVTGGKDAEYTYPGLTRMNWGRHVVRTGAHFQFLDEEPDPAQHRERVEPWLSALFQAEHLNLVVGSGLTTAVARTAGAEPVDMRTIDFRSPHADAVMGAAEEEARIEGATTPSRADTSSATRDSSKRELEGEILLTRGYRHLVQTVQRQAPD